MAMRAPSLLEMSFLPTAPRRSAAPQQDSQSANILNSLMLAGLISGDSDYGSGLGSLTPQSLVTDPTGVNPLGASTGGVDDPRYVPYQASQTMAGSDEPLIGGMTQAQLYDLLPPDAPRGGQFYMDGTEIKYLPPLPGSEPVEPENFEGRYSGINALQPMNIYSSMRAPEFVTDRTGRPDPSGFGSTTIRDFFREDQNLGPAARTLGNLMSMQYGFGQMPKVGQAMGNIFGKGISALGKGIRQIPVVGPIAKGIGDIANAFARPISNIMEDSMGPLGIVGGLMKNRPGIIFPKKPAPAPTPTDPATEKEVAKALEIDFDPYKTTDTEIIPKRIRDAQRREIEEQIKIALEHVDKSQERMGPGSGFYARSTGHLDRASAPLTMTTQGGKQRGYRSSEGLGAIGFGGIRGSMLPKASGSWGGDNPFSPSYEPPSPGSPQYASYLQSTLAPDTGALQREIQGMVESSLPFRQLEGKDKYYLQDKESGNIFLSGNLPQGHQRSTYGGIQNIGGSI
jgi:hypothetical protein